MANKLDDLIPVKLFENPIPIHSHWRSFRELVKAVVPSFSVMILAFALATAMHEWGWSITLSGMFVVLGLAMVFVTLYAIFVFEDERADKVWRQNTYNQQLTIIQIAITNMTVIQNVKTLNMNQAEQTAPASNPSGMLYPEIDVELNAVYEVARVILYEGLTAWKANNNKRPTIKPISFDATARLIKMGHPRWKAACNLLGEAQVIRDALGDEWKPLVDSESAGVLLLEALLKSRGYYSYMKDGRDEWRRAIPQGAK